MFFGIPLLITLLILAFLYLPGVVRGESVAPAGARADDQWFGGRRDTAELERRRTVDADGADEAATPAAPAAPGDRRGT